jgi:hypothetical protein
VQDRSSEIIFLILITNRPLARFKLLAKPGPRKIFAVYDYFQKIPLYKEYLQQQPKRMRKREYSDIAMERHNFDSWQNFNACWLLARQILAQGLLSYGQVFRFGKILYMEA